jgi:endonuclease/exonuclease/phosphatase family metal-dependent hydrolase
MELPFAVQRRVALTATVITRNNAKLRVAVAHLDTRAPLLKGWIFGGPAARNRQARGLAARLAEFPSAEPLVLGADLNTVMGALEGAVQTLSEVASRLDCGAGATHTSGLALDYVFSSLPQNSSGGTCVRLNSTFGSDHYPLVLLIERM